MARNKVAENPAESNQKDHQVFSLNGKEAELVRKFRECGDTDREHMEWLVAMLARVAGKMREDPSYVKRRAAHMDEFHKNQRKIWDDPIIAEKRADLDLVVTEKQQALAMQDDERLNKV